MRFVSKQPRRRPGVQAGALLHQNLLHLAKQVAAGLCHFAVRL